MAALWFAGAMSASSASRGLRNGSRGRWSARPAIKGKDMRNGNDRPRSRRTTTKATTSTDSGHLNPRPSRNHVRNKSWRKPDLEAAIQSHAGKARNPKTESWRNPTVEDSRTYKLRMNDLYQTVRVSSPQLLIMRHNSDFLASFVPTAQA